MEESDPRRKNPTPGGPIIFLFDNSVQVGRITVEEKSDHGLVADPGAAVKTDTVRPRNRWNERLLPGNKGQETGLLLSSIQNKADKTFGRKEDYHLVIPVEKD